MLLSLDDVLVRVLEIKYSPQVGKVRKVDLVVMEGPSPLLLVFAK
jgi:hypothetical protein